MDGDPSRCVDRTISGTGFAALSCILRLKSSAENLLFGGGCNAVRRKSGRPEGRYV